MPACRFRLAALILAGLIAVSTPTNALRAQCPGAHEFKPCLIQKTYQVGDLVVPAQAKDPVTSEGNVCPATHTWEQRLIRTIVSTLDPESWACHGGEGTIDYFPLGMQLVVNQTPDVQERVGRLLTALREMIGTDERPASQVPIGGDPFKGRKNKSDKLCELIERYHRACEKGNLAKAKKIAHKALELDPTCFAPKNNDSSMRLETLLNQSEDLRKLQHEWARFWFSDQPSHLTYDRIYGGIDEDEPGWHEVLWKTIVERTSNVETKENDSGPKFVSGPLCGPDKKQTPREWLWSVFLGQPKHMNYDRIHGGIE